jgi:cell wall assembly regulator SMI1
MNKFEVLKRIYPVRPDAVTLNPPATPADLDAAESVMGCRLPDGVREAYLHFNGVSQRTLQVCEGPYLFLSCLDWISVERMVRNWHDMKRISRDIIEQGNWPDTSIDRSSDETWGDAEYRSKLRVWCVGWLPGWIPIGDNDAGDYIYIDLDPAPAGTYGQLIKATKGEWGARVLADSFTEYLDRFVSGVESGALVRPPDNSGCWVSPVDGKVIFRLQDAGL